MSLISAKQYVIELLWVIAGRSWGHFCWPNLYKPFTVRWTFSKPFLDIDWGTGFDLQERDREDMETTYFLYISHLIFGSSFIRTALFWRFHQWMYPAMAAPADTFTLQLPLGERDLHGFSSYRRGRRRMHEIRLMCPGVSYVTWDADMKSLLRPYLPNCVYMGGMPKSFILWRQPYKPSWTTLLQCFGRIHDIYIYMWYYTSMFVWWFQDSKQDTRLTRGLPLTMAFSPWLPSFLPAACFSGEAQQGLGYSRDHWHCRRLRIGQDKGSWGYRTFEAVKPCSVVRIDENSEAGRTRTAWVKPFSGSVERRVSLSNEDVLATWTTFVHVWYVDVCTHFVWHRNLMVKP